MEEHIVKKPLKEYFVWDRPVRIFHWLNVLCVLGLIAIGVTILNAKELGISTDGKILLKTWHVYFGYVFVINLIIRIIWGFIKAKIVMFSGDLYCQKVRRTGIYLLTILLV